MRRPQSIPVFKKLALVLALTAHVFGASAVGAHGPDAASLLCAPTGEVSAEAEAAIKEMLRLAGAGDEEERPSAGHCGACMMMGCALAPQPVHLLIENPTDQRTGAQRAVRQTLPSLHGPPLGMRAPPISLSPV